MTLTRTRIASFASFTYNVLVQQTRTFYEVKFETQTK
jgi:hypothetical protein